MKPSAAALAALLAWGVLTIWVEEGWAWGLFQTAVFALAAARLAARPRWEWSAALVPLALGALWPWAQLLAGNPVSPEATRDAALNWFTFLVLFALSRDALARAATRRRFLHTVTVFGMLLAAVSTLQKYSSGGKIFWLFPSGYRDDVLGPFVNHNQFAAWLELLFPAALWGALSCERQRAICGTAAAVLFASGIASTSRAGFVLLVSEALWVALAARARPAANRRSWRLAIAQFAALAVVAVVATGWEGLAARLARPGPENLRMDALRASLRMARDNPWTGTGLGSWPIVYPRYESFDSGLFVNQAHNDWAQWAAEGGLPFFLSMAAFAALLWKPATRSIYGVGTVALLLHALVDYPMQQRPALAAWFFAMAGAAAAWQGRPARDP